MNSEEIYSSLSEDSLEQAEKKKKRCLTLIVVCAICVVCLGVGILIGCKAYHVKNDKKQAEYEETINAYKMAIEGYNYEVDRIDDLRCYIDKISDIQLPKQNERKSELTDEDFRLANGKLDISSIKEATDSCISETNSICNEYKHVCVDVYNVLIAQYNQNADKYNSLVEKMSAYGIENIPDSVMLLTEVNDSDSDLLVSWYDINIYKADADQLISLAADIDSYYYDTCLIAYNSVIEDYNIVATEYNQLIKKTSINFVNGMSSYAILKDEVDISIIQNMDEDSLCSSIEMIMSEMELLVENYLVALQITNPSQQWVLDKLEQVGQITKTEAVSRKKDPNGLLGKEGGYKACIYFTVKDIDSNSVKGSSVVDKGTDAGGAIEVYENLEYALNRCDYLSQFDGTLLYSGSYTVVGTMVVRTSYKLSNVKQIELTNAIIQELTKLEK